MKKLLMNLLMLGLFVAETYAQPNFVVIMTDDQRWDTLTAMPTVQAMQSQGTVFTNSYVTSPLCCPSRASFLTGQYARNTGVLDNLAPHGGATLFDSCSGLHPLLQNAGYHTSMIGKYMNETEALNLEVPPGWDNWQVLNAPDTPLSFYNNYTMNDNGLEVHYGSSPEEYSTDVIKEKALTYLSSVPSATPFFLVVGVYAPHNPGIPALRHQGTFASLPNYRPPSYLEPDISEKPAYWHQRKAQIQGNQAVITAGTDTFRRRQYESLLAVDELVAAIRAQLQVEGRLQNTFIIFTSDNGLLWHEHWDINSKRSAYEESIRVPLVITGPGVVPHTESRFALNIDLAPTIADYAGVTLPDADGTSLRPLLSNASAPGWRKDFMVEGWSFDDATPPWLPPTFQGVITKTGWKYIKTTDQVGTVVEELYDLDSDPYEMTDKKATQHGQRKLCELRHRLQQFLSQ